MHVTLYYFNTICLLLIYTIKKTYLQCTRENGIVFEYYDNGIVHNVLHRTAFKFVLELELPLISVLVKMGSSVNNDNGIVHNLLHKTAFKFVLEYPLPVNIVAMESFIVHNYFAKQDSFQIFQCETYNTDN